MQPSEMVMNLRQVFVSVLMFGVAGLLLFMYLQAWIEEQPTELRTTNYFQPAPRIVSREKLQQPIIDQQDSKLQSLGKLKQNNESFIITKIFSESLSEVSHLKGNTRASSEKTDSLNGKVYERHQVTKSFFKKFNQITWPLNTRPLNKSLIRGDKWKKTDAAQEKRRAFLQDFCKKYGGGNRAQSHLFHMVSRIYVEDRHKILYCEVPKAGCSNWKRILMVLNGLASSAYNITHNAVHYGKHLKKLDSFDLKGIYTRLNSYTKAVFVRDPMERLVSAFRDKFEHPNSYYHPVFGKAIIKKYRPNACQEKINNGSGVKFKEFIHYLLDSHRPVGMDIHWERVSKLCYPCLINYDFVGKFETLEEDANYFLQLIGAPRGLKFPNFKDRHSSDERTNADVVRQYLKDLSSMERQLIYDFYYLDYLMFNYTTPFV
ncbi:carbohydrate sulfotransferase 9 isoform X1 [Notamacropus eugenii]|uniref:carbohydrate sulfotransferase 9 isoform X1 n=1 Tax=Notamacropus eugenii TaxID=9315 RepID=UPI003B66C6B6